MKLFKGKGGKGDDRKDGDHPAGDEVPKSLAEPSPAVLDRVPEAVEKQAAETQPGAVLYESPTTDPKQVTKDLLARHSDARLDKASGALTLPPLHAAELASSTSLTGLAAAVAHATGVSRVRFNRDGAGWHLDAEINPRRTGSCAAIRRPRPLPSRRSAS
jgi:hypothetical protein